MTQLKFLTLSLLLAGLKPDDPNFWARFVGMAVVSLLLGFVIGSGVGIAVLALAKGFGDDGYSVKKAIHIGGGLGAIAGPLVLWYFVF